jgi:NADH:ubiquinone oxidoreductase subunit F (NADH-binding)
MSLGPGRLTAGLDRAGRLDPAAHQAVFGVTSELSAVVINGAEGEPGSVKDQALLIRSPYLVLAGALLTVRALGAGRSWSGWPTGARS